MRVLSTNPSYLQSSVDTRVRNLRDWGIPLGRRFRALKLWCLSREQGVEALQRRLRRDLDNARYWFRRAGTLGCSAALHRAASEVSADVARQPGWDPYLFTGQCEQARFGAEELVPALVKLQRIEFDALFDYSWRQGGLAS